MGVLTESYADTPPKLKGSVSEQQTIADKPPFDFSNVPSYRGYTLEPTQDNACGMAVQYNLYDHDGHGLASDDSDFDEALVHFGELLSENCPSLEALIIAPKGRGATHSVLRAERRKGWHSPLMFSRLVNAMQKKRVSQHNAHKSRPLPTSETPNPLAYRGYFASELMEESDDFSIYIAYGDEREYYGSAKIVLIHHVNKDDPILTVDRDEISGQYQISQSFIDRINEFILRADRYYLDFGSTRHYVDGVKNEPYGINKSTRNVERPLITVAYKVESSPLYFGKISRTRVIVGYDEVQLPYHFFENDNAITLSDFNE